LGSQIGPPVSCAEGRLELGHRNLVFLAICVQKVILTTVLAQLVIQGTRRLLLLHFEGHRLLKHRRVCSDLDERAKSRVWHVSAGIRPPFSCLATEIG